MHVHDMIGLLLDWLTKSLTKAAIVGKEAFKRDDQIYVIGGYWSNHPRVCRPRPDAKQLVLLTRQWISVNREAGSGTRPRRNQGNAKVTPSCFSTRELPTVNVVLLFSLVWYLNYFQIRKRKICANINTSDEEQMLKNISTWRQFCWQLSGTSNRAWQGMTEMEKLEAPNQNLIKHWPKVQLWRPVWDWRSLIFLFLLFITVIEQYSGLQKMKEEKFLKKAQRLFFHPEWSSWSACLSVRLYLCPWILSRCRWAPQTQRRREAPACRVAVSSWSGPPAGRPLETWCPASGS